MHYRAVATRPWQRVTDILLVIIGFVAMAYTTGITAISWVGGSEAKPPGYCDTLKTPF
jgi:proton-coupled amino acid transporter